MRYTTIRRWYPYIKKWVNTRTIITNKCLNLEQKYPKFWILFRSIAQLFNGWPLHHTDLITELSYFWSYTIIPKLNSIIRFLYTLTSGKRPFIALSKVHGDWETKLITSNAINCYTKSKSDGSYKDSAGLNAMRWVGTGLTLGTITANAECSNIKLFTASKKGTVIETAGKVSGKVVIERA